MQVWKEWLKKISGYYYEERNGKVEKVFVDEDKQKRHERYQKSARHAAYKDGCSYDSYPEKRHYYEWDLYEEPNNGPFSYGRVYDEYIDWMPTANMNDIMDAYKESSMGKF